MNIKKILASTAASVLAVSAMSVAASAKVTNPNGDEYGQTGKYVFVAGTDLGADLDKCAEVVVAITVDDAAFAESGCGGGIATNNEPFAWIEFGNDGSGKDIITDGKTIDFKLDAAFAQGESAQIVIEGWWGSDFSVNSIVYKDASGNDLKEVKVDGAGNETPAESTPAESTPAESTPAESTPAESAPAESTPAESAPAESTPAESAPAADTSKPNTDTGIEGVAAILGVAVVAGGAMIVAKKRK